MAARAGVRIVPVSIIGTHLFMPPSNMAPHAVPKGVKVVVHPPLDPPADKEEAVVMAATSKAIASSLPLAMQPLQPDSVPRA